MTFVKVLGDVAKGQSIEMAGPALLSEAKEAMVSLWYWNMVVG